MTVARWALLFFTIVSEPMASPQDPEAHPPPPAPASAGVVDRQGLVSQPRFVQLRATTAWQKKPTVHPADTYVVFRNLRRLKFL
jgi:hypothetical protein